jgi:pantoate--beta-alanine ligase
MGYLHEGHLSLVRMAKAANSSVAVSIFVNPTQFGPSEDFARYPRDTDRDLSLLAEEGVDLVFLPPVSELYPNGFQTYVAVEKVTKRLEGAARPTHFRGVATIVAKLFNIVQPTRAYFGQKDAQQVVVIRQMVRDLAMPVEVVVGEIVREEDGLAMSSRNSYLSPRERQAATVLYRALTTAQTHFCNGARSGGVLRTVMQQVIDFEPLSSAEYVSAADPETLLELDLVQNGRVLLSLAVRIGSTRLLDAMLLEG